MLGGLALIVVLIVYQFRARRPLLTIRTVLTSSIPVAGVGVALFAAAASVAATALTANVLLQTYSPVRVGLLYLPELGGAVVMAVVFGIVITRRAMHYLPLVGMALLAAGIVVFRIAIPASQPLVLLGAALTGLALGATVAPALFVAGFSLQSNSLQRVFAIIELLRAVAAFMVAPDPRPLRRDGGDRSHGRYRRRALDRLRPRNRRRRVRCGRLRAERSPTATPRPGPVPRRRDPGLVLAAAAGPNPIRTCRPRLPRPRMRQATRHRITVTPLPPVGPVLFAYDGSELAAHAIAQAAAQLRPGETRWSSAYGSQSMSDSRRPTGNTSTPTRPPRYGEPPSRPPPTGHRWRARPDSWREASPSKRRRPGRASSQTADEHNASLIVLGPHRRSGLLGHLQGSVAAAVVAHTTTPVLIVPQAARQPIASVRRLAEAATSERR